MQTNQTFMGNFEACSVLLMASWVLVAASAAYAQTPPARPASTGSRASPTEATATDRDAAAALREADRNGDGQLNREEAQAMPAVWMQFDQIDTNKNRLISLDELAKAVQK